MKNEGTQILIVDLGSQYTEMIRRSLRYGGFNSTVLHGDEAVEWVALHKPKGIILSGGSSSIYDTDAPKIPDALLSVGIPLLAISYAMQWMAYTYDKASLQKSTKGKSYGPIEIYFDTQMKSKLFENLPEKINAWAVLGDSVTYAPKGFVITATSKDRSGVEAMEAPEKSLYAVHFHPEVEETEDENIILHNFVQNICGCAQDYGREGLTPEFE